MSPELSRQLGQILGRSRVTPQERRAVIDAAQDAKSWDDLPSGIRSLLDEISQRRDQP